MDDRAPTFSSTTLSGAACDKTSKPGALRLRGDHARGVVVASDENDLNALLPAGALAAREGTGQCS